MREEPALELGRQVHEGDSAIRLRYAERYYEDLAQLEKQLTRNRWVGLTTSARQSRPPARWFRR